MAKPQAVTSIPRSPEDDRNSRMIRYSIGWLIRLACLIACVFLRGWWLLVPAIVAIGGPLVLVVLANAVGSAQTVVQRPGAVVRSANPSNPR
jgi:hypothetical protein